jgi:hypothetical protein
VAQTTVKCRVEVDGKNCNADIKYDTSGKKPAKITCRKGHDVTSEIPSYLFHG